jgi:hypothetical protein
VVLDNHRIGLVKYPGNRGPNVGMVSAGREIVQASKNDKEDVSFLVVPLEASECHRVLLRRHAENPQVSPITLITNGPAALKK